MTVNLEKLITSSFHDWWRKVIYALKLHLKPSQSTFINFITFTVTDVIPFLNY